MGKHRDRMEQALMLRGFATNTRVTYLRYARAFVVHCGRSADKLGRSDVQQWLLWLLNTKPLQH